MNHPTNVKKNARINVVLNQQTHQPATDEWLQTDEEKQTHDILIRFEDQLKQFVGLDEVKRLVKEIYAWLYMNQRREQQGLKANKQVLHMIFKGNPGTGKTTVARIIARFFHDMNVLSKGHFIEAERADLVGEYIGHTAQKTRDLIKQASGGVLFVDEAYSLARGGEKDFGKEAIDTLVKGMEDKLHDFVLILAGYSKEMDHFLSLNPGLPSRFPITMSFPNYTIQELMEMIHTMAKDRDYQLSKDAENAVRDHIKQYRNDHEATFSNGRYIRNLIERAIRQQAVRLMKFHQYERQALMTLVAEDFKFNESHDKL
ncbi:stage V sporulation protein K [Alkalicoccobacillus gibsonii]|jgi:stage V sporulation protein K|uniref:stage V sporulation protein K n=1 Tax=Alkalicoccobacillus gibsonii TaxID=79881 RepID=UPI0019347872|nr:stage V sporulation protein K [Alkalicoccobacillus gibsonii]MBM0065071.1 stage V sporulation protein K [Alkalicoccobacillus gibsonii]